MTEREIDRGTKRQIHNYIFNWIFLYLVTFRRIYGQTDRRTKIQNIQPNSPLQLWSHTKTAFTNCALKTLNASMNMLEMFFHVRLFSKSLFADVTFVTSCCSIVFVGCQFFFWVVDPLCMIIQVSFRTKLCLTNWTLDILLAVNTRHVTTEIRNNVRLGEVRLD